MKNLQTNLDESNEKIISLQDKVVRLRSIVDRYMLSSKNLQTIIENQKMVLDKIDIGYDTSRKQKSLKNVYAKSQNYGKNITCYKCNKIEHKFIECKTFNSSKIKVKQV